MANCKLEMPSMNAAPSDVKLVYYLYLAGVLFGITPIIGVVIAYVNRGAGPGWVERHYHYQIRTFWLGLIGLGICSLLMLVLIGYVLVILLGLWWIIRTVKGLKFANKGRSVPSTEKWL